MWRWPTGRLLTVLLAVGWLVFSTGDPAAAQQRSDVSARSGSEQTVKMMRQHCLKCHGAAEELAGELDLRGIDRAHWAKDSELLSRIIDVLSLNEMPPEDEPDLAPELRSEVIAELKQLLQNAPMELDRTGGTPVRRMNRFQYNNAVTDLFELDCNVFTLPERMLREHKGYFQPASGKMPDVVAVGSRPLGKSQMIEPRLSGVAAFPQDLRAEHGFDNRADHLSLSPLLMHAFLQLGQSITQSNEFNAKHVGIWTSFFAEPAAGIDQATEARRRLGRFLRRAFRRPVDDELLRRYSEHVAARLEAGQSFSDAMKAVAAAAISSPMFLYLYDKSSGEGQASEGDDFDLASRLSFFLWGSLPDEELLKLAEQGQLSNAETLQAQVSRMLADRKLKRFCDSFPAQWLQLDRILSSLPNREAFPDFYFAKYRASMHMMLEPLLLFETVLIENRPVTDLIAPDFSYRSGLLEAAYGELAPPTAGAQRNTGQVAVLTFRRDENIDQRTGGVITNAAVMTMTSGPERTKPITRGAWLATVVFNNPPDPPPADVPPLSEEPPAEQEQLTLRERLGMHRERADCRGCHEQIDPLGFALENFDPVGRWRSVYENGREVDMAGKLFRERPFGDIVQFKQAIVAEKDRFARALAAHLLSYAVARPIRSADHLPLDRIVQDTAEDGYRLQNLIQHVVLSQPFLHSGIHTIEPVDAAKRRWP